MKNQLLKPLTTSLLLLTVVLFTQCGGKDDEDPKSTSEYLTSSKWTFDDIESSEMDAVSLALYAAIFDGYEVTYKADGTYESLLPAFGDFGSSDGKWELSTDEKTLYQDKGTELENIYTIKKINDSSFQFESTIEDDESNKTFKVLTKMKHL